MKKTAIGSLLAVSLLAFGAAAHAQGYNAYGPRGDMDRDGIQNRYDRDRDGDGIPNARDPHPNRFDRVVRHVVRQERVVRYAHVTRFDRDGDGVPNRLDRFPNNFYRS